MQQGSDSKDVILLDDEDSPDLVEILSDTTDSNKGDLPELSDVDRDTYDTDQECLNILKKDMPKEKHKRKSHKEDRKVNNTYYHIGKAKLLNS